MMEIVPAYGRIGDLRPLFSEYTRMLVEGDSCFASYLDLQGYDDELINPEKKYAFPDGRLYLAYQDGSAAGCIALKRMDEENCELKRLYVRPPFRGRGIAKALCLKIIADASDIGYRCMYLDTLPFLHEAVSLYRNLGFETISRYNDNPIADSIFMRLKLSGISHLKACR